MAKNEKRNVAIGLSTAELSGLHAEASAEFLKGYRGYDNKTGQVFAKGLKGISEGKVNPEYAQQNIKQQAGYSAEVAATSRDNADAILSGDPVRTSRSDDLSQYGRNHNVVDRVQILDGQIISGTETQMKFVGDRDQLLKNIAEDSAKGDAKFARYRGVKLELPSEQVPGAAEHCHQRAAELRQQADDAAVKGAPDEVVKQLRENAAHYDELAGNILDSDLTTDEAIFYREHPKLATALDIARTSHRAGLEGAKFGAAIGGSISLLTNAFALVSGEKEFADALVDTVADTATSAGIGYATAFSGSAIGGVMQQSGSETVRALSGTALPALVVSTCLALGGSINQYVQGNIDAAQLLTDVGQSASGVMAANIGATLGQIAIPIPVLGGLIGGMIGHTVTSMFYRSTVAVFQEADAAEERYWQIKARCDVLNQAVIEYKKSIEDIFDKKIAEFGNASADVFLAFDSLHELSADEFSKKVNEFAEIVGESIIFYDMEEFSSFMESDDVFKL
ncbi:hypothetical protein [Oceanospirillum sanctuarii]|uniref:hypothetical protein n=1 Tax=Oceanospirillum sanctuarii TaxID=1434821 RepID=UPI000A3CF66B|nr:hypothetical protein [Oceanospirillum sanctuarii]